MSNYRNSKQKKSGTAVIFPGQGSQYPGMGMDFYNLDKKAKAIFDDAEKIFGGGLLAVIFNGNEDDLKKTHYAQPAIFAVSAAIYEVAKTYLKVPDFFAGHSLGEYTALYAAGAFDLETGIRLVKLRGSLMQNASEKARGGMAAVLGMDKTSIDKLCKKVADLGYVSVANYNTPNQTVISGEAKAIDTCEAIAKEMGAKRYIRLQVAGAFHSRMMQPAFEIFSEKINNFFIKKADVPIVANYSAKEIKLPEEIRESLSNQIINPVRWAESIEYMKSKSIEEYAEIGPGSVLAGLIKKIDSNAKIHSISRVEDIF